MLVVIPMAGLGSRFSDAGYKEHKPLIEVNGKTLVKYAVESLDMPSARWIFVCREQSKEYMRRVEAELYSLNLECEVIWIDRVTSGAAETAYIGLDETQFDFEPDEELVITNCDQYLEWSASDFIERSREYDSSILTYKSTNPKNSFAEVANGRVVRLVEKNPISDVALVGVHYWKKAEYFLDSAQWLMKNRDKNRESYVSETYNYLLEKGHTVGSIGIEPGRYWSTGTPEDLSSFKGMIFEYNIRKPTTWVFDLDGTVFLHSHKYSRLRDNPQLAPGVLDTLNELDSRGDTIILMSARKESSRAFTEAILDDLVVPYDHLILGVSQGTRVMVNDIRAEGAAPRARAVNVVADRGFKTDDLE